MHKFTDVVQIVDERGGVVGPRVRQPSVRAGVVFLRASAVSQSIAADNRSRRPFGRVGCVQIAGSWCEAAAVAFGVALRRFRSVGF